jgi:hypothetical protein
MTKRRPSEDYVRVCDREAAPTNGASAEAAPQEVPF